MSSSISESTVKDARTGPPEAPQVPASYSYRAPKRDVPAYLQPTASSMRKVLTPSTPPDGLVRAGSRSPMRGNPGGSTYQRLNSSHASLQRASSVASLNNTTSGVAATTATTATSNGVARGLMETGSRTRTRNVPSMASADGGVPGSERGQRPGSAIKRRASVATPGSTSAAGGTEEKLSRRQPTPVAPARLTPTPSSSAALLSHSSGGAEEPSQAGRDSVSRSRPSSKLTRVAPMPLNVKRESRFDELCRSAVADVAAAEEQRKQERNSLIGAALARNLRRESVSFNNSNNASMANDTSVVSANNSAVPSPRKTSGGGSREGGGSMPRGEPSTSHTSKCESSTSVQEDSGSASTTLATPLEVETPTDDRGGSAAASSYVRPVPRAVPGLSTPRPLPGGDSNTSSAVNGQPKPVSSPAEDSQALVRHSDIEATSENNHQDNSFACLPTHEESPAPAEATTHRVAKKLTPSGTPSSGSTPRRVSTPRRRPSMEATTAATTASPNAAASGSTASLSSSSPMSVPGAAAPSGSATRRIVKTRHGEGHRAPPLQPIPSANAGAAAVDGSIGTAAEDTRGRLSGTTSALAYSIDDDSPLPAAEDAGDRAAPKDIGTAKTQLALVDGTDASGNGGGDAADDGSDGSDSSGSYEDVDDYDVEGLHGGGNGTILSLPVVRDTADAADEGTGRGDDEFSSLLEETARQGGLSDSTGHSPITAKLRLRIQTEQRHQRQKRHKRMNPSNHKLRSTPKLRCRTPTGDSSRGGSSRRTRGSPSVRSASSQGSPAVPSTPGPLDDISVTYNVNKGQGDKAGLVGRSLEDAMEATISDAAEADLPRDRENTVAHLESSGEPLATSVSVPLTTATATSEEEEPGIDTSLDLQQSAHRKTTPGGAHAQGTSSAATPALSHHRETDRKASTDSLKAEEPTATALPKKKVKSRKLSGSTSLLTMTSDTAVFTQDTSTEVVNADDTEAAAATPSSKTKRVSKKKKVVEATPAEEAAAAPTPTAQAKTAKTKASVEKAAQPAESPDAPTPRSAEKKAAGTVTIRTRGSQAAPTASSPGKKRLAEEKKGAPAAEGAADVPSGEASTASIGSKANISSSSLSSPSAAASGASAAVRRSSLGAGSLSSSSVTAAAGGAAPTTAARRPSSVGVGVGKAAPLPPSQSKRSATPVAPAGSHGKAGRADAAASSPTAGAVKHVLIPLLASQQEKERTVTVVFDLDETLCNNHLMGPALLRPGALHILKHLRSLYPPPLYKLPANKSTAAAATDRLYGDFLKYSGITQKVRTAADDDPSYEGLRLEMVLWTASVEMCARPVVARLDPNNEIFDQFIFRDIRWYTNMDYTKELIRLGRNMDRCVIVENAPASVCMNRHNAILVHDFVSNRQDRELYVVKSLLTEWMDKLHRALGGRPSGGAELAQRVLSLQAAADDEGSSTPAPANVESAEEVAAAPAPAEPVASEEDEADVDEEEGEDVVRPRNSQEKIEQVARQQGGHERLSATRSLIKRSSRSVASLAIASFLTGHQFIAPGTNYIRLTAVAHVMRKEKAERAAKAAAAAGDEEAHEDLDEDGSEAADTAGPKRGKGSRIREKQQPIPPQRWAAAGGPTKGAGSQGKAGASSPSPGGDADGRAPSVTRQRGKKGPGERGSDGAVEGEGRDATPGKPSATTTPAGVRGATPTTTKPTMEANGAPSGCAPLVPTLTEAATPTPTPPPPTAE